jgi:SAM-dependent methyltransferase
MEADYDAAERLQADHYNRIAEMYAEHYGDRYSQEYRVRFINRHLFEGIDLKGKTVLEAMCGSGETTRYMLDKGAVVVGLDVSQSEIDKFKSRWPAADGVCSSIFETNFEDASFDVVVVVGGLHHLHPHVSDAIVEMHRILKKDGYLCFVEPHKGSTFDLFRQFWYKHDDLFAANEEAIDVKKLSEEFGDRFAINSQIYSGNIAYLFVLNSMIFRIPFGIKKLYSKAAMKLEESLERFQTPRLACMAIGQWRKR